MSWLLVDDDGHENADLLNRGSQEIEPLLVEVPARVIWVLLDLFRINLGECTGRAHFRRPFVLRTRNDKCFAHSPATSGGARERTEAAERGHSKLASIQRDDAVVVCVGDDDVSTA